MLPVHKKNFTLIFFTSLSLLIFQFIFVSVHAQTAAAAFSYYVSPNGSDTNNGSQTSPFKTFSKSVSVLVAGDTLNILGGTYTERLSINKSGTASAPISIKSANTQNPVVINLNNSTGPIISTARTSSYIHILGNGIEAKNSSADCIDLNGQYNLLKNIVSHDCQNHGIYSDGAHNVIDGNTQYFSNLSNSSRNASSGWGSAIKLRVGADDNLIQNNLVYRNYGEGIAATRSINTIIRNNRVYDNFAVQIYIDNAINTLVENNFATCSANSGFEYSNGNRPNGIAIGEEFYSGWGAQLAAITIKNNVVAFCSHGLSKWNSDVSGGLKGTNLIAFNTFWGSSGTAISFAHDSSDETLRIANNLIQSAGGTSYIESYSGMTIDHNFWVNGNALGTGDKTGDVKLAGTPGYTDSSYALSSSSPARDAGAAISSVTVDYFGSLRSSPPDMGALEYGAGGPVSSPTPAPTVSPSPTPTPRPSPSVSPSSSASPSPTTNFDINGDGIVNVLDIKALISVMLKALVPAADFNQDGKVNSMDFALIVAYLKVNTTPSPSPSAIPSGSPRPSASASPNPTPTAAPSPSPITGFQARPEIFTGVFNGTGTWNLPASQIPVDPSRQNLVSLFYNNAGDGVGNVNTWITAYTYPVYIANANTPMYPVDSPTWSRIYGKSAPYDPTWQPSAGSDAQIIIIDPARNNYYDLWQFSFSNGRISVSNGSSIFDYHNSNGINPPSRGSGIAYYNMLTTPEDVASGTIRHALSMTAVRNTSPQFVAPAVKSDGQTSGGIPIGTRFVLTMTNAQLDAWVAAKKSNLRPLARALGYALRDYGWVVTDSGGGSSIQLEGTQSAVDLWKSLGVDDAVDHGNIINILDGLDWPNAVVLQPR